MTLTGPWPAPASRDVPALRPSRAYLNAAGWLLLAAAAPLLLWLARAGAPPLLDSSGLLFWRNLAEVAQVTVALLIFAIGYRALPSARQGGLVLLGVAFLGVGLLQFLQAISPPGLPGVLGLAAHLLAALALLTYALLPPVPGVSPPHKRLAVALVLAATGSLGAIALLQPALLPDLPSGAVPGRWLNWLLAGINLGTLALLLRRPAGTAEAGGALGLAAALLGASELLFSLQASQAPADAGVLGHLYRAAAFLYLFQATYRASLRDPLAQLRQQRQHEKMVFDAAPDGVLWVDAQGQILLANPAMETLAGYPASELVGRNVDLFLPPALRARHAESVRNFFRAPRTQPMNGRGLTELRLMHRDGHLLPVDIALGHWEDAHGRHAVAYIRDLRERQRMEEALRHQATHDELTGLPNRWLFQLQLSQALARAKPSGRHVAVLILDLDDFKTVNDSFGHLAGDELLVQVSHRLRGVLRANDSLARLGGDEFAILLTEMAAVEEAANVAAKLLLSLEAPYPVQEQPIYASGSIGLACYPDDAPDSAALLRYADMAMYQAKQSGRNAYACYSAALGQQARDNMQLHGRLKEALRQGRLNLLYQPQVDVQSGAIVGAEALLRWQDEVLGEVSPARFIPVAESTGLILPLSDWVLETACRQIAAWSQAGTPLRVAVNFSAQQFRQRDLAEKVRAALERSGAPAQWLGIEITESVAMAQPLQACVQLESLVALGCSVALDDFGTGYSSLAYLKALPVSKLKIDRQFIKDIPHDPNDVKLCRSIMALAQSLGLSLVAEGVETDEQLAFLRQYGCQAYQGWLFAKAMDAADLTARLPGQAPPLMPVPASS